MRVRRPSAPLARGVAGQIAATLRWKASSSARSALSSLARQNDIARRPSRAPPITTSSPIPARSLPSGFEAVSSYESVVYRLWCQALAHDHRRRKARCRWDGHAPKPPPERQRMRHGRRGRPAIRLLHAWGGAELRSLWKRHERRHRADRWASQRPWEFAPPAKKEWATERLSATGPVGGELQDDCQSRKAAMILEVAILDVKQGEERAFEEAFARAQSIIAAMGGYRGHESISTTVVGSAAFRFLCLDLARGALARRSLLAGAEAARPVAPSRRRGRAPIQSSSGRR